MIMDRSVKKKVTRILNKMVYGLNGMGMVRKNLKLIGQMEKKMD